MNAAYSIVDSFAASPEDDREELLRKAAEQAETVSARYPLTLIDRIPSDIWKNWNASSEVSFVDDEGIDADQDSDDDCYVTQH
ncbi:hypothetical protein [Thalassospira lucentensis]|uniref:hypothetical protein n=1 Tax=Thalassospira lucentensis TaxID=168935 RepID=UPI003D2CC436